MQRRLINLLDLLDADRVRYPRPDLRGRLPWLEPDQKPQPKQVATFVWPWETPWSGVDAWARTHGLKSADSASPNKRSYSARSGLFGGHSEFRLIYENKWFTFSAWTTRGKQAKHVDGSLRSRRTRLLLDDLLERYDRPLVNEATKPFRAVEWIRSRV